MGNLANFQAAFACCLRADGTTKYWHPCACPGVVVWGTTSYKQALLVGFYEFGGQSNPPVLYTTYTISNTVLTWTATNTITHELLDTYTQAGTGGAASQFSTPTGALTRTYDTALTTTPTGSPPENSNVNYYFATNPCYLSAQDQLVTGADANMPYGNVTNLNSTTPFGPPWPLIVNPGAPLTLTASYSSKTVCSMNLPAGTVTSASVATDTTGGTFTITLSDADTESYALSRATAYAFNCGTGLAIATLRATWESRNSDAYGLLYETTPYAIILTGLIPGLKYKVTQTFQKRTARGRGFSVNSPWATYDALYGPLAANGTSVTTFTATSEHDLMGGTWTNPAGPYDNTNVTLDGSLVLDPTVLGQGWEAQLESVVVELA